MQKKDELALLLDKYVEGTCTAEEFQILLHWIWQLDVSEGQYTMNQAEEAAIDAKLHQGIMEYVSPPTTVVRKMVFSKRTFGTVAAALMGILLTGVVIWQSSRRGQAAALVTITSGNGHIKKILLPDSTEVVLNYNSSLSYSPDHYGDTLRKVVLEGEGYFNVHSDPSTAFVVQSGNVVTQALGTAFNIESYKEESEIRVSLLNGKVRVSDTATNPAAAILEPGQMIAYSKVQHHMTTPQEIAVNDVTGWINGNIVFNNIPLDEALHRIEHYYAIRIVYNKKDIKGRSVTAVFHKASWQTVLSNVLFAYGLNYSDKKTYILIGK